MPKLSSFLRANGHAERVDSFFVHCAAVPSQEHRRLKNLLNFDFNTGITVTSPSRNDGCLTRVTSKDSQ
jgi:hypothetical protein